MEIGKPVIGIDFDNKEVLGKLENIVGFGDVAIVRVNEDRLGLRYCYVSDIKELE
jgi:hypothetical protein